MSDDDKVGYGKPPKAHRWPKGKSGNPGGSSRKARARKRRAPARFADMVLEEAYRPIKLREGNRIVTMSAQQAVLRALQIEGLKGNRVAAQNYLKMTREAQREKVSEVVELFDTVSTYKENYEDAVRRRKERGLGPPLPHPDDLILDRDRGELIVTGPASAEEMELLLSWLEGRQVILDAIDVQRQDVEEMARLGLPPDRGTQKLIDDFERMLQCADDEFGRGWKPRVAGEAEPSEKKKEPDAKP
jgi:hypothetical protein